jgi:TATA-binding protein-associated factor
MLRELLSECGIISDDQQEGANANHRVLIFAQHKATLDLVVRDVLTPATVPSLRIDGTTDSSQRFAIADRFNADPSIPVLLLTTRVGGLGLNLTGADTVIFLEHDWNPQADLQAMDRAHRLGQRRTVNVYRLVMKGTLEERILGLQAFKKRVAGTVVTQQNSQTGPASDLLDLFVPEEESSTGPKTKRTKKISKTTEAPSESGLPGWISSVLAESNSADADAEYQQEFDLEAFVSRLNQSQS